MYICIYIYDIKASSFLEPHFVFADVAIHGLARVGLLGFTRLYYILLGFAIFY